MAEILARFPVDTDFTEWKTLWEQYLVFYETVPSERHTESLWKRILDADDAVECLVAVAEGRLVGMVQYLPHADTWDERPICYLSDLYVDPSVRGKGIGALLIRSVEQLSRDKGWSGVYWQTAEDNERARVLYDKITGGVSRFIIYELGTEKTV